MKAKKAVDLQGLDGLRREGIRTLKAKKAVGWQPTVQGLQGLQGLRREGIRRLKAKKALSRERMDTIQCSFQPLSNHHPTAAWRSSKAAKGPSSTDGWKVGDLNP